MGRRKNSANDPVDPPAIVLDRASPIPLYVQVRNRLLTLIGGWDDPARRFYSDIELMRMFDVSRATVREALVDMVEAGVLRRTRGLGTLVSERKVEEKLTPVMDIRRQWAAEGRPFSANVLAFERIAAPENVARQLDIEPGESVLFVKRVRTTQIAPVAIDWRYIPANFARGIQRRHAAGSLMHLLWDGIPLDHSELQIEAALSGPDEVELLHVPDGSPVLIRHLVYFDTEGRRVMAGRSIHRADLMRYSVRVDLARSPVRPVAARGQTLLRKG